jgi:phosphohistidine phosphatase
MEIWFLRHGDAAASGPGGDAGRELTKEGRAALRGVAARLAAFCPGPEMVLSSPLVRARQTAQIAARALGAGEPVVEERLAPGFDAGALREIIREHRSASSILLVGHEPDLHLVVAACTGGRVEFRKASLACVGFEHPDSLEGVLEVLLPPDNSLILRAPLTLP